MVRHITPIEDFDAREAFSRLLSSIHNEVKVAGVDGPLTDDIEKKINEGHEKHLSSAGDEDATSAEASASGSLPKDWQENYDKQVAKIEGELDLPHD